MDIIELKIYKSNDGKTWCSPEAASQWNNILELVERAVPYSDGKKTVLNFLEDYRKELKEILK